MTADLPPEAITAAAEAIRAEMKASREVEPDALARVALEAAAAAIRAATFPRCPTPCDDDCEQACHEVHDVPSHREHDPVMCVAGLIVAAQIQGAAEERARIRLLAERHAAIYAGCGGCCDPEDNPDHRKPFADLIGDAP